MTPLPGWFKEMSQADLLRHCEERLTEAPITNDKMAELLDSMYRAILQHPQGHEYRTVEQYESAS